MTDLGSYRLRALTFPLIAMGYLMVALQPVPYEEGGEVFPFFNWSLFSYASPEVSDAVALIHSVNDQELETPQSLYDLPEFFNTAARHDVRFAKVVERYALAKVKGETENAQAARALMEDHYMKDAHDVEYSIGVLTYDPIKRYRTREVISVHELGRFVKP
jgi:hypothetical protein